MVISGNVMVDRKQKETTRNVVLDETSDMEAFRSWAESFQGSADMEGEKPLSVMQISHSGRQTPISVTGFRRRPMSISGSRLRIPGIVGAILSRTSVLPPKRMGREALQKVVTQFATTAKLAQEAGFDWSAN